MTQWTAVGLLAAFMLINFCDKAVFGISALPIMRELHLSHAQFGVLGGAFFVLFSLAAPIGGWLGDRVPVKFLIAGMALAWSVAQLPMLWPVPLAVFFACRLLLGASEGPAYSTAVHAGFEWFAEAKRPLVAGLIGTGAPLGAALVAFGGPWVVRAFGWHVAYALLGLASVVWSAVWLTCARGWTARKASPEPGQMRRRWTFMLNRTNAGVVAASFTFYWISALAFIWLPAFLETGCGFTPEAAGFTLGAAFLLQIPVPAVAGWVSTACIERGFSSETSHVAFAVAAISIAGIALIGLSASIPLWLTAALTIFTVAIIATVPPVLLALVAEVTPSEHRSTAMGSIVGIGSLGGILSPMVLGKVVDAAGLPAGGYHAGIFLSGAVVLTAAIAFSSLARPSRDRAHLAPQPS